MSRPLLGHALAVPAAPQMTYCKRRGYLMLQKKASKKRSWQFVAGGGDLYTHHLAVDIVMTKVWGLRHNTVLLNWPEGLFRHIYRCLQWFVFSSMLLCHCGKLYYSTNIVIFKQMPLKFASIENLSDLQLKNWNQHFWFIPPFGVQPIKPKCQSKYL